MGKEECGFFPNFRDQFVEIVGRRRSRARFDFLRRRSIRDDAVFFIVEELAFLTLLHRLDREAELFFDLIMRNAVEIGNARVNVENGLHGAQQIFARIIDVVDERLRQNAFVAQRARHLDAVCILHLVDAIDAGLDGNPAQEMHEPSRRDARHLRNGLRRIGQLPSGGIT